MNLTPEEDITTRIEDTSTWCLAFESRLNCERDLPSSPTIQAPSINQSSIIRLPYRYSSWKSSTTLSRQNGFTRCEHHLIMNLLLIIEKICRRNRFKMILSSGTLLGSWRHHDIIPWDDDVDVMIPFEFRQHFLRSLDEFNQNLIRYHVHSIKEKSTEYYKIFYTHTNTAGEHLWKFPFIDIYFYKTNRSHFWEMTDEPKAIALDDVFPLILRPLGELWLPTPRRPEKFFSFDPFDQCIGHSWNHRTEAAKSSTMIKCDNVRSFYPFVYRSKDSELTEILILNNSIIHSIIYS